MTQEQRTAMMQLATVLSGIVDAPVLVAVADDKGIVAVADTPGTVQLTYGRGLPPRFKDIDWGALLRQIADDMDSYDERRR